MATKKRTKVRKKKQDRKREHLCKLFPVVREDILSLQEAKEQAGWSITAFDMPHTWRKAGKGEGSVVAVLDSGCDLDHPDLKKNIKVVKNANLFNPRKAPWDDNQHGTHVSSIIAAVENDIGMVGVAPEATIMPIKVLDSRGQGSLENVARGIRIAVDNGADMCCMSLGAPMKLQQVRKAIQYANKRGVPCFVAAGNAGRTKEVYYPAAYPETIAIGSIDENFDRSNFSNTGRNLDFMAPGGKIFGCVPDDWYAILSGTSMACPFAVGVAALVLSYKRKKGLNIPLKCAEDYRKIFRSHTIPVKNKAYGGKKFFQGFGIIDPRKFMKHLNEQKMI